jgi:hypothetical protein
MAYQRSRPQVALPQAGTVSSRLPVHPKYRFQSAVSLPLSLSAQMCLSPPSIIPFLVRALIISGRAAIVPCEGGLETRKMRVHDASTIRFRRTDRLRASIV